MDKNLLTLEAESPDELKEVLRKLAGKTKIRRSFCALAIGDPEFLLYPFHSSDIPLEEAMRQTSEEIRLIFEMPLTEIEYDFQVFEQEENYFYGVCAAIPKKRLMQYLSILDKNILTPLRILPYTSTIIDYYFHQHREEGPSFAMVDFSRRHVVGIAVFKHDRCQMLRQIAYEQLHDAVPEIIDSMKNACLLSGVPKLERIHFAGTLEDKMEIISDIESAFQAKIERDHSVDIVTALSIDDRYFDINFARRYTYNENERKTVMALAKIILVVYGLFVLLLGAHLHARTQRLKVLKMAYPTSIYDYAKNLKMEMDAL